MVKKRKPKTTFSLAIKKGGKFKPIPKVSKKRAKEIILGKGKPIPKLYAVKKKGGRVVESRMV